MYDYYDCDYSCYAKSTCVKKKPSCYGGKYFIYKYMCILILKFLSTGVILFIFLSKYSKLLPNFSFTGLKDGLFPAFEFQRFQIIRWHTFKIINLGLKPLLLMPTK